MKRGATITILGLGRTGSALALLLLRQELSLRLIDMGRVGEEDMSSVFHEEDITKFKAKQAKIRLAAIDLKVQVKSFHEEIDASNVFLLQGDVIVDATNSAEINALSLAHATKKKHPLVVIRAGGNAASILVLQKAASLKIIDKLKAVAERSSVAASAMAAGIAAAEIGKILQGSKSSKLINCDVWHTKMTVKKI
jgi:tRNA A37 threonylcarbamoyladenosine dehydratase